MLGRFLRTPLRAQTRKASVEYRPQIADQQLRSWTTRLGMLSTSAASKMYVAQLSALMSYYNRQVVDSTKEIDWASWKSRIITKGLVDKVHENFKEMNSHEYQLDQIFNDIFARDSKAVDNINNEMAFHTAVWLDNYTDYVSFLSELDSISSPKDYTTMEYMDMHSGMEAIGNELTETHNYFPGTKDDVNLYVYMGIQFAWGKKMCGFYKHPADDFKAGRATKNTMGR